MEKNFDPSRALAALDGRYCGDRGLTVVHTQAPGIGTFMAAGHTLVLPANPFRAYALIVLDNDTNLYLGYDNTQYATIKLIQNGSYEITYFNPWQGPVWGYVGTGYADANALIMEISRT